MRFHLFSMPPAHRMHDIAVRPLRIRSAIEWREHCLEIIARRKEEDLPESRTLILQDFFQTHPSHDRRNIMSGSVVDSIAVTQWTEFVAETVRVVIEDELLPFRFIAVDDPGNKGRHPTDIRSADRAARDAAIAKILWNGIGPQLIEAAGLLITGFGMYGMEASVLDRYRPGPVLYGDAGSAMDALDLSQERHPQASIPWVPYVGYFRRNGLGMVSVQDLTARLVEARDAGVTDAIVWFPVEIAGAHWTATHDVLSEFWHEAEAE